MADNILPRDDNGAILSQSTYRTITSARKTVTTAGTAVQLVSTSTLCKRLDVTALFSNTKNVALGGTTVSAVLSSEMGVQLSPGSTYTFFVNDASKVWIDSLVNSEGVSFNYFQ